MLPCSLKLFGQKKSLFVVLSQIFQKSELEELYNFDNGFFARCNFLHIILDLVIKRLIINMYPCKRIVEYIPKYTRGPIELDQYL